MSNERQDRAARAEQMRRERDKADKRQRNGITIAIVVVVLALIAVGGFAINKASNEGKRSTALVTPKNVNSDFAITYDATVAAGKAASSPVTVTLYEDFQCPACKAFEDADGAFLRQAVDSGDITVEYRPISFLDKASTTEYSSRALNAAMCVLDTKGVKSYTAMHDVLYANQPAEGSAGLDDAKLGALAKEAGAGDLTACIKSRKFDPWLHKATDASSKAGVNGTPTVMINGKKVEGPAQNGQPSLPRVGDLQKAIAAAKA